MTNCYVKYDEVKKTDVFDPNLPFVVKGEKEVLHKLCDAIHEIIENKGYVLIHDLYVLDLFWFDNEDSYEACENYGWNDGDWVEKMYIKCEKPYVYVVELPKPTYLGGVVITPLIFFAP